MYPLPNPKYGITPVPLPEAAAASEPAVPWQSRIPGDLLRIGPPLLALVIGAFVGRGLLTPMGVPSWLGLLGGAIGIGGLLLMAFRRMFAAAA